MSVARGATSACLDSAWMMCVAYPCVAAGNPVPRVSAFLSPVMESNAGVTRKGAGFPAEPAVPVARRV